MVIWGLALVLTALCVYVSVYYIRERAWLYLLVTFALWLPVILEVFFISHYLLKYYGEYKCCLLFSLVSFIQ